MPRILDNTRKKKIKGKMVTVHVPTYVPMTAENFHPGEVIAAGDAVKVDGIIIY